MTDFIFHCKVNNHSYTEANNTHKIDYFVKHNSASCKSISHLIMWKVRVSLFIITGIRTGCLKSNKHVQNYHQSSGNTSNLRKWICIHYYIIETLWIGIEFIQTAKGHSIHWIHSRSRAAKGLNVKRCVPSVETNRRRQSFGILQCNLICIRRIAIFTYIYAKRER